MDPEELRARLRTGKDSRTEYKSTLRGPLSPETITKESAAFANSGGGEIFFGVEDDGSVSGVGAPKDAEELQRRVAQAHRDAVTPALRAEQVVVELDGKLVVVVRVPGYLPGRPFRGRSKYFVRDGPVSREASRDELSELFASASTHHYDEQTISDASLDDLDPEIVRSYLSRAHPRASFEQREHYLKAIGAISSERAPTVAGILLFASDPQRFFPDAYVSAVAFRGDSPWAPPRRRDERDGLREPDGHPRVSRGGGLARHARGSETPHHLLRAPRLRSRSPPSRS